MGIGISFTGHDGRSQSANAESVADAKSLLGEMMASSKDVLGMLSRSRSITNITNITDNHRRKKDRPNPIAAAGVKIDPMGSIEDSPFGIRLMGDRFVGALPRSLMYGYSATGTKGFFGFDVIDPPQKGRLVGPVSSDSVEEDKDERKQSDVGAFAFSAVTRIVFKTDEVTGLRRSYFFIRDMSATPSGRIVAVSAERRIDLGFLDADGSFFKLLKSLDGITFVTGAEYTSDYKIKISRSKLVVSDDEFKVEEEEPQFIETKPLSTLFVT